MSDQVAPFTPVPITDPYDYVDLIHHHDGTVTRKKPSNYTTVSTVPDLSDPAPVLSKDIPINQSNNTWARVYIPRHALEPNSTKDLLPLILYYPGGGFVISSAATPTCYNFCSKLALQLSVVVVSIDYRVGPEHRLPAAYDDAIEALHWIKFAEDSWLRDHANLTNCFIMGCSAGGNIAYHVGLRVATEDIDNFKPLKINGLILHYPFFGGSERTESELRMADDLILPLIVSDVMWKYSLPVGANRDHEYCNPAVMDRSKLFDKIKILGWKILIATGDRDPGIDRQVGLLMAMKEKGVKVESRIVEGDYHGKDLLDTSNKSDSLLVALKNFIFSTFSE
ncbi:hypothetical protein HS088_TW13G00696 [Tripterygium wilfordii]|uniref:Alpha/beta hydrolase fold-3 domain-containing protein n=1 Tax=Tripterygium wilfordii TaxID=458696 RepID=A0A7J7CV85_TRIWF|nr:probable carboxylesterase 120 [Tripterygium wilfordii]KAF5737806.1 hypothetical protein HS088_TW13G00696 [Tripterygium wilfordii]